MDKYNNLTIINKIGTKEIYGKKRVMVLCKCDCGAMIELPETRVTNGRVKSCGCLRKNKTRMDLSGQHFYKLLVVKVVDDKAYDRKWECLCDCGSVTIVSQGSLLNGHTKSCGCLKSKTKFGKSHKGNEKLYNVWRSIRSRCNNPHNRAYKNYGGRGIRVCEEWSREPDGYKNFYSWAVSNGYTDNLSIDRIDVNGDYEPFNCRWATLTEQANNKRNNLKYEYNGECHTLSEWAGLLKLDYGLVYSRLKRGWNIEKAFKEPKKHK